jgi:hypothetical protein
MVIQFTKGLRLFRFEHKVFEAIFRLTFKVVS